MVRIAAALGQHVHMPARRAARFSRIIGGLHLELGQRVHRRRERIGHGVVVHYLDAIQEEAVGGVARAIRGKARAAEGAIGLADRSAPAPYRDGTRRAGLRARNQLRQLDEVAPVEGQVDNLLRVDDRAHGRILRLQRGAIRLHVDRLRDAAHLDLDVDAGGDAYLQGKTGYAAGLEALLRRIYVVLAGGKKREAVAARLIRGGFTHGVGLGAGGLHLDVGHQSARGVGDNAGQGGGGLLRPGGEAERVNEK